MDIRREKTQRAIKEAFWKLRSKKEIEKITVKELCQLAEINKSTFYSYYDDIYCLSDILEKETVASILSNISKEHDYSTEQPEDFAREICIACISNQEVTKLLFSGQDSSRLADRLEQEIKELIYMKYPEFRDDISKNILLSFCIQGAHHAYMNNRKVNEEELVKNIELIIKTLQPLY